MGFKNLKNYDAQRTSEIHQTREYTDEEQRIVNGEAFVLGWAVATRFIKQNDIDAAQAELEYYDTNENAGVSPAFIDGFHDCLQSKSDPDYWDKMAEV